jgi:hypothetical protein
LVADDVVDRTVTVRRRIAGPALRSEQIGGAQACSQGSSTSMEMTAVAGIPPVRRSADAGVAERCAATAAATAAEGTTSAAAASGSSERLRAKGSIASRTRNGAPYESTLKERYEAKAGSSRNA